MKGWAYTALQCTWGALQTIVGLAVLCLCPGAPRFRYHGAVVTRWRYAGSVSLGLFVFVTDKLPQGREELARRLVVHEYGHTVQSLLLGPLYLAAVGLPSLLWANLPALRRMRRAKRRSYFAFYTERWANRLGERATGEASMGEPLTD